MNEYLSDPQILNSYAYSRNNPIIRKDPSGNSSLSAWITRTKSTAAQVVVGKVTAQILSTYNRPATSQLFGHAFNLNPGKIVAGNESVISNSIKQNESYTSQLESYLNSNPQGGDFVLQFNPTSGDTKTATGKMTLNVSASRTEGGQYIVNSQGVDTYNFGYDNSDYGSMLGTAASLGYLSQQKEALSTFQVEVNFKHEYTPRSRK